MSLKLANEICRRNIEAGRNGGRYWKDQYLQSLQLHHIVKHAAVKCHIANSSINTKAREPRMELYQKCFPSDPMYCIIWSSARKVV